MRSTKDPMNWAFYSRKLGDNTIMVHRAEGEGWDVYYKRPEFPFVFAFGLPLVHKIDEVFDIAESNIDNYLNDDYEGACN